MNGNFAHFEAFATRSTPQEWIERGEDLMKRELKGLSWPSSSGSWIYIYMCNQCLSKLKF
jgi:hypothetical protein